MTTFLAVAAGVVIPPVLILIGAGIERSRTADRDELVTEALRTANQTIAAQETALTDTLSIVRHQREVLTTFTFAAEELLADLPAKEATHRLAWAVARTRAEIL